MSSEGKGGNLTESAVDGQPTKGLAYCVLCVVGNEFRGV